MITTHALPGTVQLLHTDDQERKEYARSLEDQAGVCADEVQRGGLRSGALMSTDLA